MPLIQLQTKIKAPLWLVFDLSRSIDAHMASIGRADERVVHGKTSGTINMGESLTWETRRFGMKKRVTVKVTSMASGLKIISQIMSGRSTSMRHTRLLPGLACCVGSAARQCPADSPEFSKDK